MPQTTTFNNLITSSRGTQSTLVDSTGRITYAPHNLLTYSEQFDNAVWTKTRSSIVSNVAVAPDGTTTADKIIVDTTTGSHVAYQQLSTQSPGSYIFSVYAKAAELSSITLQQTISTTYGATFDLLTGAVSGLVGGAIGMATAVGNGWWRCSISYTTTTSIALTGAIYTGFPPNDGTSGVYIWGAQLEQVTYQTTPSTYNPTTVKNLLGYSEAFDNAAWTKSAASITTNAIANPINGAVNAQKLMEDSANVRHQLQQIVSTGLSTYTYSIYAKAAGRTKIQLGFYGVASTGGADKVATFDLTTGQTTAAAGITTNVQSLSNGWFRCSITYTMIAAGSTYIGTVPAIGSYAFYDVYQGDGNSGVYIYGAQLSDSASLDPYVPTPGAAPSAAAYYGPRFDYDPATLLPKGLLIEEARTNLLTYSQDFTNAVWNKTNITPTAGAIVSPSGVADGQKLAATSTGTGNLYTNAISVSSTAATFSVYVKQGTGATTGNYFGIRNNTTATTLLLFTVNLSTGALVSYVNGTSGATIQNVGNGWWRIIATVTSGITSGDGVIGYVGFAGQAVTAGDFIYAWGAQLETGSFAASYIPTVASTATRNADVCNITGSLFSQWYSSTQGTFSLNYQSFGTASTSYPVLETNDGTSNNRALMTYVPTSNARYLIFVNGSAVVTTLDRPYASSAKWASAYSAGNYGSSYNNQATLTNTYANAVPTQTTLSIGNSQGGNYLNGWIRSVQYYPYRLSDTQIRALTA